MWKWCKWPQRKAAVEDVKHHKSVKSFFRDPQRNGSHTITKLKRPEMDANWWQRHVNQWKRCENVHKETKLIFENNPQEGPQSVKCKLFQRGSKLTKRWKWQKEINENDAKQPGNATKHKMYQQKMTLMKKTCRKTTKKRLQKAQNYKNGCKLTDKKIWKKWLQRKKEN